MAPKRRQKKVVKTTKKVVEETVKVAVVDEEGNSETVPIENPPTKVFEVPIEEGQSVVESITVVKTPGREEKRKKGKGQKEKETREEPVTMDVEQRKEGENEEKEKEQPSTGDEQRKEKGQAQKKNQRKRKRRNAVPSRGDLGMGGVGGYKTYVYRVLKQVHPTLGMSSRAMDVLDMMMADMFERLADEAKRLSKYTGKLTISSRVVHDAVRLVLPGDLCKHAISEGTKAVAKYMETKY